MNDENNDAEKRQKRKQLVIFAVSAAVLIILILYLVCRTFVPVNWTSFSSKRIKFIEDKYMISLDHAQPIRYKVVSIAQDMDSEFEFEVSDHREFIENDFHGSAIIDSYVSPDGDQATYKCYIDGNKYFTLKFTGSSGRYHGRLVCYSDKITPGESGK